MTTNPEPGGPPAAKNGLSSYLSHYHRRKYIRKAYPAFIDNNSIDLWYGDSALFGRIDEEQYTVVVRDENLKSFVREPNLFAVNFVVDAYEDFAAEIIHGMQNGIVITPNTFLLNLVPRKAYINPLYEQEKFLKLFDDRFLSSLLANNEINKIKNISDYINAYYRFIKQTVTDVSITLCSIMLSKFVSPLVSGLLVELSDVSHADDVNKYRKFVKDPNFRFYQNTARKYGFKIDYNAPWRLVADVSSAEMKEYMSKYEITSRRELFSNFYDKTSIIDLEVFKERIYNNYNDLVRKFPVAVNPVVGEVRTRNCVFERSEITRQTLDSLYGDAFWLNFYFQVRVREEGISLKRRQNEEMRKQIKKLYETLDFERALSYIEEQLFRMSQG
jgi:hypothetical protein